MSSVKIFAARLRKYLSVFFDAISWIGGLALLAIMVVTVANVITRIWGAPISGVVEISSLLFVLVVAFGLGCATLAGEHVEINILTKKLPERVQKPLAVIITAVGLATWILIAWRTIVYALLQHGLGEFVPILHDMPVSPWRFVFSFGLIILCVALLIQLVERMAMAVKK
ncbi:MAG: TRAP transporter small permease [Thermoleophilia bacterium]|nr:TRAP transporter small permease [Thermoleophilia bacterium]